MVFFGGGIPLKVGERLIGALGVSGGTGEQDDEIARYGHFHTDRDSGLGGKSWRNITVVKSGKVIVSRG